MEQAQRNERRCRGFLWVTLDALVALRLVLQLDREHDRGWNLRSLELHQRGGESDPDLRVPGGVIEDLELRVVQLVRRTAHAHVVRPQGQDRVERLARGLVRGKRTLRHAEAVL